MQALNLTFLSEMLGCQLLAPVNQIFVQQLLTGDVEQVHLDAVIFDRAKAPHRAVQHDIHIQLVDFLFDICHISHNEKQYSRISEKVNPKKSFF